MPSYSESKPPAGDRSIPKGHGQIVKFNRVGKKEFPGEARTRKMLSDITNTLTSITEFITTDMHTHRMADIETRLFKSVRVPRLALESGKPWKRTSLPRHVLLKSTDLPSATGAIGTERTSDADPSTHGPPHEMETGDVAALPSTSSDSRRCVAVSAGDKRLTAEASVPGDPDLLEGVTHTLSLSSVAEHV